MLSVQPSVPATQLTADSSGLGAAASGLFGGDGFSFKDLFDIINPLQQLPIVGSIYRAITGDTISAASSMVGGFLLGGPIGLASAGLNAALEAGTGADLGSHILTAFQEAGSEASGYFDVTANSRKAAGSYQTAAKLIAS